MTGFAEAVALTPDGPLRWSAEVPTDWAQGRTAFGGLLAAMAAQAAEGAVGPERPLRTLDVAFVAPIPPGPVSVEAEVLGAGRAVTQLAVTIRSGERLGCRVHVVAGAGRASGVIVPAPVGRIPPGEPAAAGIEVPYLEGVTPTFTQHIEYRWCSEHFPFTGASAEHARIEGWCRHRGHAAGLAATVALADAWPPAVLPMVTGTTPASTVRWALHLAEAPVAGGPDWVWYEARTLRAAEGYATATAELYAGGALVAWSEQLIAVFDTPSTPG